MVWFSLAALCWVTCDFLICDHCNDKVPNVVVNERTKLPDMPSLIADRRHSLFGHICRLPENTPASQALQLSIEAHTGTPPAVDWKSPPGRPRRNWLQQVEEDVGLSRAGARTPRTPRPVGPHDLQGPHVTAGQFFYRPYSITSHTCTILFSARCNQSLAWFKTFKSLVLTMTQLLRAYRPTSKSVCLNNL